MSGINPANGFRPVAPALAPLTAPVPVASDDVAASYDRMLDQLRLTLQPAPPAQAAPTPAAPGLMATLLGGLDNLLDRMTGLLPGPGAPEPTPAPQPEASKPVAKPDAKPSASVFRDVKDWFISQVKGAYNPNEDVKGNGNCGPASLTMIAKAFGKLQVMAEGANKAIEETRKRMGAGTTDASEKDGTSYAQLLKGAASYGLDANQITGKLDAVKEELAKGRLVIAHVKRTYMTANPKAGHYTVVTKVEGDKVYMNDPATSKGPIVISAAEFLKAQQARGTFGLISIGA